jgi:hypothetical protein
VRNASRALLLTAARWTAITVGVAVTTFSFVRLVDVHNQLGLATPWWWIGLIGFAATLLGLGLPWERRSRPGGGSPPSEG